SSLLAHYSRGTANVTDRSSADRGHDRDYLGAVLRDRTRESRKSVTRGHNVTAHGTNSSHGKSSEVGRGMSDGALPAAHASAPGESALSLEILLLGSMEVRVGGHSLPRLRS